jgi:16S rRNA (guanine527-N7)-methyltransferase
MSEKLVARTREYRECMSNSEDNARLRFETDYNVSRETMEGLERYRLLLIKWAKQINLVGPSTLVNFWERHILDCAQILNVSGPEIHTVADFGSGAGLPGLVLATLLADKASDYQVTLVEVSGKRCGFLREAARALDVKVTIVQEKIELVQAFPVDLVTARAFAPLDKLLDYAHAWAEQGARVVFLKGEEVQREIDGASTNWAFQSRINTSVTDSRGCVVEILDLERLKGT